CAPSLLRARPRSTFVPYTTLFRSLAQLRAARALREDDEEGLDQTHDRASGVPGQLGDPDPLIGNDSVVLKSTGQVTLIAGMDAALGQCGVDHLFEDDRLLPLFGSEQRHEVGAGVDAVVKGAQTGIWPGIDLIGLGTVEDRRQIHPSLDNQTIDRTVVSEELPAPGSDRIRFAIDGDVVGEIVEDV